MPYAYDKAAKTRAARSGPSLVHLYLSGAAYPASKAALRRYAEAQHAERVLPVLARLPEREYRSALEVVKAVAALEPKGVARPEGVRTP